MFRLLSLLPVLTLAACQPSGQEFIGAWQHLEKPADNYHVAKADRVMFQVSNSRGERYYAVLSRGHLSAIRGFEVDRITYLSASDRVEIQGAQYRRMR